MVKHCIHRQRRTAGMALLIVVAAHAPVMGQAGAVPGGSKFGREGSLKVRVDDPRVAAEIESRGGRRVADYQSFSVLEVEPAVLQSLPAGRSAEVLGRENLVLLNAGAIDTSQAAAKALQRPRAGFSGKAMHLVHFAGPVQPDWRDALVKTGADVVTYIPNNAYLVYGDANQLAGVQGLARTAAFIQWDAEYADDYKIDPQARAGFVQKNAAAAAGTDLYAIQLVADAATNNATRGVIDGLRLAPVKNSYSILNYVNIIVRLPAAKLPDVARRPDVISIQPYIEPTKNDERQDQIVAGNLSGNFPSAPGYLAWLASRGFTQAQFTASGSAVDLTDSGIDNATTSPNHFGLYVNGTRPGTSRVIYNRLEGTPNSGSTLKGCDGHGTINSHIICGYDDLSGFPFADASGYHHGLGVAPFVKVGSSVVFDPNTFTAPNYPNLQSKAYQDNARISSNSWGANTFGGYNSDAQAYDALVRDAQPAGSTFPAAGNQEMVIVFANGNAGPGLSSVGSPGTAKNVISVGAAENVNAFGGSDGCNIADTGADSANDIISFSSRGPCSDGRKKPDIMAPGTHITGGVVQTASPGSTGTADPCYNGTGVCGGVAPSDFFPSSGQQFYTASSGTSHSTPAVAGGCALIRQFFLNQGMLAPSPAMTKALLMNSARYMTGAGANDTLWSNNQGMGEMDLGEAFNRQAVTPTLLRDQLGADMFTATGQARAFTGTVADNTKPFRVTLAWTDAPGSTTGAAYRNDLDLTVTIAGNTYKGNVFAGASSVSGGSADPADNVENVFLPAGVTGNFAVNITASNINSDGVPNVGGSLDQDFALVVYNANLVPNPVIASAGSSLTSESCSPANGTPDPTETVTVSLSLRNVGTADTSNLVATLQASGGVTSPSSPQNYGPLIAGGATVARSFTFTASGACGGTVTATLQLQDGYTDLGTVAFTYVLGILNTIFTQNFDAVTAPNLPGGWTATVASGTPPPWVTTTAQRDTLPNSVFASEPITVSDNRLDSPPIAIMSGGGQLTFRHNFNLESGFDGGVLEIAIGAGAFTDILTAGGSFVTGGYTATISTAWSSPIGGRQAWSGSSSGFITTTVNLPAAAAGQTIKLRWRAASDNGVGVTGWYVDTVSIASGFICCGGPPPTPSILVQAPNGGESWIRGTTQTMAWNSVLGGAAVNIDLLQGGSPVLNIATGAPNSGSFDWSIPAGQSLGSNYRVRVFDGVSTDESDANFTIAPQPPPCLVEVNFESGLSIFTINNSFGAGSGLWHLSTACQSGATGHTTPTSLYYGSDGTCDYNTGNTEGVATSSTISLAGALSPMLSFKYFLNTEGLGGFDIASVEVSQNGGAFNAVAGNYSASGVVALADPSSIWLSATVDLSAMSGSNIQVRLRFRTVDNQFNAFPGFYVDDVKICAESCSTPPAAPTNPQAIPSTICAGQCSTLFATVGGSETVDWYAGSCAGPLVPGGSSPGVCPTTTTTYYAKARDIATGCSSAECAPVTVTVNPLPSPPANPTPADATLNVALNADLSWTSPANPGCPKTYDVFFGTTDPPTTLICDDISATTCDPGPLALGIHYYWRVVSNNCCGSAPGPVWSFTTVPPPLNVIAWRSVQSHTGLGDQGIPLNMTAPAGGGGSAGPTSESRTNSGLTRIQMDFNRPCTFLDVPQMTGSDASHPEATDFIQYSDTTMELVYPLVNGICYTMDIVGVVQATDGGNSPDITGDTDCAIRMLVGDTTSNGVVNLGDVLLVRARTAQPVSPNNAAIDVDRSGAIDGSDLSLTKTKLGDQTCP